MSPGPIDGRGAPSVTPRAGSVGHPFRGAAEDDWCLLAVALVQAVIGCAYGFVSVDALEAMAATVRPPATPREHALIHGVVFGCLTRKLRSLSPAESALLTRIVQEIARMSEANVRRTIADLRELAGIHGPGLAELLRDAVDTHYAQKLSARTLARTFKVTVTEARAAFEQRFGESIEDYIVRRRVDEGVCMVRAGISVEAAALHVGWRGKRHFFKAVGKLWGTTPGRLRDQAPRARGR